MAAAFRMPTRVDRPLRSWVPYFVLVVSVLVTAGAAGYAAVAAHARDRIRFQGAVQDVSSSIEGRISTYTALLHAGAGLFADDDNESRQGFRGFVDRLDLPERYPGIQGIGYIARVSDAGLPVLQRWMEQQGVPHFQIQPAGKRPEYYPVIYFEAGTAGSPDVVGRDRWVDPIRRAAMEQARDQGTAVASAPVATFRGTDDSGHRGVIVYEPVYRGGGVPGSVAARREALIGFVYGPLRASTIIERVMNEQNRYHLGVRVFDGAGAAEAGLLYDRLPPRGPAIGPQYETTTSINVSGRLWDLSFASGPDFYRESAARQLPLILTGGLLISLLLFGVTRSEARARTEAERAVAGLRESEEALRESEARLRRLVDANVIGIMIAGLDGRIIEANDAFLEIVGYTAADLRAGLVSWRALTRAEHAPTIEQALEETRRLGRHEPFEAECIRRDGRFVPVLVGIAYLGGRQNLMVAFLLDLTEQKHAEIERERLLQRERQAHADAQAANRAKDAFLATVSHELRTPLNAILGWAKMLRMGHLEPGRQERALEVIERNAQTQVRLIEDLLDISRVTSGKIRLELETLDLAPVLLAALDSVRPAADAKGVTLDAQLAPFVGVVRGDPERLQQVFWNVLTNAIKFTPPGGEVALSLARVDSSLEVRIVDTGMGIPADFLPHVFEPFRQGDTSTTRSHGGVGLGLAIVHHLVELHGGTIRAESAGPGQGSTFTIRLPARAGSEALLPPGHEAVALARVEHREGEHG
jgi:PAS domain S-box-containing protein